MSEIAPELQERVRNAGRLAAYETFVMFLNPKFRGDAFSWERLPEMSETSAKASWFNAVTEKEYQKFKGELDRIAAHAARDQANIILSRSDILSWWKS